MSAPRKEFTTKGGTILPLMNLKGKEYLQVAHRLVWLVEEYSKYTINTEFLSLSEEGAVARTTVNLYDKDGVLLRSATATKRETKKDFPDFIEKSETGSLGRALAMLGLGTQFSTQDLDEGNRLADSPLPAPGVQNVADTQKTFTPKITVKEEVKAEAPKKSGFGIKKKTEVKVEEAANDGWE